MGERIFFTSMWENLIGRDYLNGLGSVPQFATEWHRVDASVVDLTLRQGAKFHNGDEMTAEDIAFSFGPERMFGHSLPTAQGKTIPMREVNPAFGTEEIPPEIVDPHAARNGHWTLSTVDAAFTPTPDAVHETVARFGALPERTLPRRADLLYAARVMVERVLPDEPAVALAWFSEPDTSFHYLAIGSEGAATALRDADRALGDILDWIEAQPDADAIALVVASDHGQIATRAAVPLLDEAVAAGFSIAGGEALGDCRLVLTGGSSGGVWSRGADAAELEGLAAWLMEQDCVSHLFSRGRDSGPEASSPAPWRSAPSARATPASRTSRTCCARTCRPTDTACRAWGC